jgi:hypothetical protein
MAIGSKRTRNVDTIEAHTCMDAIDWEATSERLGKTVSMASYIESPSAKDSLQFVPKDECTLTRFTLQIPPATVIDAARSNGREDSISRQAFWLALRSIRRIEFLHDGEEEARLKFHNAPPRERIAVRGRDAEAWNKVLHEDLQDQIGNNTLTEMGLILLLREEQGEDENF